MSTKSTFGDFIKENKGIAREYLDIRLEILRLQLVKMFSKSAGYFVWTIVSLLLLLLFMLFVFLIAGFWLSELTGSIITGFALTAVIILVTAAVITLLRRILFVNPIIRNTIRHLEKEKEENSDNVNPEK